MLVGFGLRSINNIISIKNQNFESLPTKRIRIHPKEGISLSPIDEGGEALPSSIGVIVGHVVKTSRFIGKT
jgi:hypothetical protein